jgi:hypothetical protein
MVAPIIKVYWYIFARLVRRSRGAAMAVEASSSTAQELENDVILDAAKGLFRWPAI